MGDSILHIPDDWREIMKRKEIAYYNGRVTRQSEWREGLDYSWWPNA